MMFNITTEQMEKLKEMQSIDELKKVLKDEGIELTEDKMKEASRYFESGKMELEDSELEMVAGGKDDYEAMAKADGRTFAVIGSISTPLYFCGCKIEEVWARERTIGEISKSTSAYNYIFTDVKCYKCGKHRDIFKAKLKWID